MLPQRRSPSSGFDVFMPVSVMPYRSRMVWPVRAANSSKVAGSSGAEPETNRRIVVQAEAPKPGSARRRE